MAASALFGGPAAAPATAPAPVPSMPPAAGAAEELLAKLDPPPEGLTEQGAARLRAHVQAWHAWAALPDREALDAAAQQFVYAALLGRVRADAVLWAQLSEAQAAALRCVLPAAAPAPWPAVRALGVPLWLRDDAALRQLAERVGRAQYAAAGKDPTACTLMFVLAGRLPALVQLYRASDHQRVYGLVSRDFAGDAGARRAAAKNAFVLMSKGRYELAAAMFLLAGQAAEAVGVAAKKLRDVPLAVLVARLAREGDLLELLQTYAGCEDGCRRAVFLVLMGRAAEARDAVLLRASARPHGDGNCVPPPAGLGAGVGLERLAAALGGASCDQLERRVRQDAVMRGLAAGSVEEEVRAAARALDAELRGSPLGVDVLGGAERAASGVSFREAAAALGAPADARPPADCAQLGGSVDELPGVLALLTTDGGEPLARATLAAHAATSGNAALVLAVARREEPLVAAGGRLAPAVRAALQAERSRAWGGGWKSVALDCRAAEVAAELAELAVRDAPAALLGAAERLEARMLALSGARRRQFSGVGGGDAVSEAEEELLQSFAPWRVGPVEEEVVEAVERQTEVLYTSPKGDAVRALALDATRADSAVALTPEGLRELSLPGAEGGVPPADGSTVSDTEAYRRGECSVRRADSAALQLTCVAAHPRLPLFVAGGRQGRLSLWQFGRATALATMAPGGGGDEELTAVAFSPGGGDRVASGHASGELSLGHVHPAQPWEGRYTQVVAHSRRLSALAFVGSASVVATAGVCMSSRNVCVWDTLLPAQRALVASSTAHSGGATALLYAEDSRLLVSGGSRGDLCVFDMRQRRLLSAVPGAHGGAVSALALLPGGRLVSGSSAGDLRLCRLGDPAAAVAVVPGAHARGLGEALIGGGGVMGVVCPSSGLGSSGSGSGVVSCGGDGVVKWWSSL